MVKITKISENKGIEIPKELISLCDKVCRETIKLGNESSNYYKSKAKEWLNWLRINNIENLEIELNGTLEVWNILLCILHDEI